MIAARRPAKLGLPNRSAQSDIVAQVGANHILLWLGGAHRPHAEKTTPIGVASLWPIVDKQVSPLHSAGVSKVTGILIDLSLNVLVCGNRVVD